MVAAALADPQVTGLQGRTPAATLSAALYTEAKKPDGAVVLVGREGEGASAAERVRSLRLAPAACHRAR